MVLGGAARLTPLAACAMFPASPTTTEPPTKGRAMCQRAVDRRRRDPAVDRRHGPVPARPRRSALAQDVRRRPHLREAGGAAERPGTTAAGRTVAASARRRPGQTSRRQAVHDAPGRPTAAMTRRPLGANPRARQMPRRSSGPASRGDGNRDLLLASAQAWLSRATSRSRSARGSAWGPLWVANSWRRPTGSCLLALAGGHSVGSSARVSNSRFHWAPTVWGLLPCPRPGIRECRPAGGPGTPG